MISCETAKELKEVGFPQHGAGQYWCEFDSPAGGSIFELCDETYALPEGFKGYHSYYIPTLSELIAWCGDRFMALRKGTRLIAANEIESCWWADGLMAEPNDIMHCEGSTPEEAVARLGIVIHKN